MSSQEVAVDSASPANDQAASVAANPAGAADVTHLTDEHEISDNGIEMTAALSHMPSTDIEATLFDDGADYSSISAVGKVVPISLSWQGAPRTNADPGITLSQLTDINLTVANKAARSGGCCGLKKADASIPAEVQILFDNCGCIYPGEMVAIMGASGAGKTSLLNVLSRRNTLNEGSVLVNKHPVESKLFNRLTAFVQQEDLFLGSLTVREHLRFQAQLRMDQRISDELKFNHVEQLIKGLRLTKCQNNVIGALGSGLSRGISGGERKRLSFASEILTNPSILFADEPTSGLDSDMAYQVVKMMKAFAASGRTVLSTIHQPSSETYSLFNKLLLMWHGRTVYYGSREGAVAYFAQFGPKYACPQYTNPADFFIKMLAVVQGDARYEEVLAIAEAWETSELAKSHAARAPPTLGEGTGVAAPQVPAVGKLAALNDGGDAAEAGKAGPQADNSAFDKIQKEDTAAFRVEWTRQFGILFDRALTNTWRDPILTKVRMGQTLFIGILAGLIYLQVENNQLLPQNLNGAIFFILINQSFSGLFGVIQTFPLERPIFQREHESGAYSVSAYYWSKTCADFLFQIFFPTLFVAIAYWMIGITDSASDWLVFTGIVLLAANVAISLGYLISTAVPSVDVALAVAPVVILPFLLFGGLFVNTASIPDWLAWAEYMSWFRYAFNACAEIVWKDRVINCDALINGVPDPEKCPFTSGQQVLDISFSERDFAVDIGVLSGMVVLYRFLAFLALYLRTRGKQNE